MKTICSKVQGDGSKDESGKPQSLIDLVTPLLITFNEAPNLERTLRQLEWARRIVVIDSFSTDETLEIVKAYPQAEIYQRTFDSFARQCNFGLGKVYSEWVLSIDADYVVPDELVEEIGSISAPAGADGFQVRFKYCVWGRALRGTLYPPRTVLYRTSKGHYVDDGHAHHVVVDGAVADLKSFIHHDDRKPLSRWTSSQAKYVEAEVRKFAAAQSASLSFEDRLRKKKTLAPFAVMFYCLILHRGLLDGWPGWYYAFERTFAEALLALKLIELENPAESSVGGEWVRGQNELASLESRRLRRGSGGRIRLKGRLRRLKVLVPIMMFPYAMLARGRLFFGWSGCHSAYKKTIFELLLAIHMIEAENIVGGDIRPGQRAALTSSRLGEIE